MPIIYVHGVNTRDPKHFDPVREYLRRIVAPEISADPQTVSIRAADWFKLCEPPKWEGISRPRTMLMGQGASETAVYNETVDAIVAKVAQTAIPSGGAFTSGQSVPTVNLRIDSLSDDDLADLMSLTIPAAGSTPTQRAKIGIAADRVARDPKIRVELEKARNLEEQLRLLADAVRVDVESQSGLAAAGPVDFLKGLKDRIHEGTSRLASAPGAAVSVAAGELRPVLNDFVTRFLGDVLYYMKDRGSAKSPGPIPRVLIDELKIAQSNKIARGGEPIVLLSHSMGGQIVYDVVTSFLPAIQKDIKVDFWCATASQVGFFEELNMFLASSSKYSKATGNKTPITKTNLGHWWNVWDHNDILSFTTQGIFEKGIDDGDFWSGMSLAAAHGGYLERPSFYRKFADKLKKVFPNRGV